MKTIQSKNTDWGFFGTSQRNYNFSDAETANIFNMVAHLLVSELKLPVTQVVSFLDGKYGRHFADELSFHGAKEGMTGAQYINVVRTFLKKTDDKNWVKKTARSQEDYMNERAV